MILKLPRIKFYILFVVSFLLISGVFSPKTKFPFASKDSENQSKWVDSILQQMTVKEKIAQLFMVAAYSNKESEYDHSVEKLIENYKIGGLIFMQGSPFKQAVLTNRYQKKSKIPLLIGIDGEWGLSMRLDSTYKYPWNLTFGATFNDTLLEMTGKRIGEQCIRLGIHINFAPVVDINTNPSNPIIGNRAYGSDKDMVAKKATFFVKGLQSQGVMACAKHFPGHGETDKDSHKTLPTVTLSKTRIDEVELFPYKQLFNEGVASVMTAHINVPVLQNNPEIPASLSYNIVTKLLQNELNFRGLIITDALNMKGATNYKTPGELELNAFLAGNDILLFSENVDLGINAIYNAFKSGKFSEERLDFSVRKILNAKYWVGLDKPKEIKLENLYTDLYNIEDELLHRQVVDNAVTLIQNKGSYPIKDLSKKIGFVSFGIGNSDVFFETLRKYADVSLLTLDEALNDKDYDLIIAGYFNSDDHPWKKFSMSEQEKNNIQKLAKLKPTILTIFTTPYALLKLTDYSIFESIVLGYQSSNVAQELTAQKIFGASKTLGTLPVSIDSKFIFGMGFQTDDLGRLSYGLPEEVGMDSKKLALIDEMANKIIDEKMAPGMQILVARYGKVIFQKSYGYFTYDKTQKVNNKTIYDLASITKIAAGLPMVMSAYENEFLKLDDHFGKLFPFLQNSNKENMTIREALSHKSGLKAWIPYYKETLDSVTQEPLKEYYSSIYSSDYPIKVAKDFYVKKSIKDTIYKRIIFSEVKSKTYRYSDLFFTIYKEFAERKWKKSWENVLDSLLYKPLGVYTMTYNPLNKISIDNIAPTEQDNYFRKQLLQGYVHDMAAALLGGVSGHAGLFANSNDVAKVMQLYLQYGYYGGQQYFKKSTIQTFNDRYYSKEGNRRGLGFDKPDIQGKPKATCGCVSDESFGHSGFTGNYTWADPVSGVVYVFLSNRVYPDMNNKKLVNTNMRTEIQKLIQQSIIQ